MTHDRIEEFSREELERTFRTNVYAMFWLCRTAPGPVWTPLIPSTMPEEKVKTFGQQTSFGRAAQPVEIALVFVFLASNEARS